MFNSCLTQIGRLVITCYLVKEITKLIGKQSANVNYPEKVG